MRRVVRITLGLLVVLGVAAGVALWRVPKPTPASVTRPSVVMADGVRLAVDVVLPRPLPAATLPAVLIQTRSWRSFELRTPAPPDTVPRGPREPIVERLVEAGVGVVVADVRGTGASEGLWTRPWSTAEQADAKALVDWIVAQPWSNGAVATTGTGYEGSLALLTAATGHPAIKAALAREIEWDLADELFAPGGVRNLAWANAWARAVSALDRGQPADCIPWAARQLIRGVHPTDDDLRGESLRARLGRRTVADVAQLAAAVRSPVDPLGPDAVSVASVGPQGAATALKQTSARLAIWGSWWDGATADAVLRAAAELPRASAVIGPWSREGDRSVSPLGDTAAAAVALDDVVSFLSAGLRGGDAGVAARRWYVAGAGRWEEGDAFPRAEPIGLYLDGAGALVSSLPEAFEARLDVDFDATTGTQTRWTAGPLLTDVRPPPRPGIRGRTQWESAPLTAPQRWFGAPSFRCGVSLDGPDAALHVSLERVRGGSVAPLTDGVARVGAGAATVRLRPVALALEPGDALRLTVAGADRDTLERVPAEGPRAIVLRAQIGAMCVLSLPALPAAAP